MSLLNRTVTTLRDFDWWLLLVSLGLTTVGLAAIYSVDLSRGESLTYFPTQITALVLGILVLFIAGSMHVSLYQASAVFVYGIGFLLLVLVLFLGEEIRGTTGWFRFGGFSFQPAEFAKVALILFLGWWIQKHRRRFDRWQFVFTSGLSMALFAGLIVLQPDIGSAFILGSLWFGMLLLTGTKKRYIAILLGLVVITVIFAWFFVFKGYQKERLFTFLDPERDPLGAGYNVTQSIIAVGAGQLTGRGLGFGSQSQLHFLPEAQTDFIFSVIAEELGFIGVAIVFTLYAILIYRLVRIALRSREDFGSYVVLGIAVLFCTHLLINVGGAIGLLPLTGVTLPFLSYGGSSLLMNFLLIGVAESIARASVTIHTQVEDV
ncbi:MAG TPA: rod shape-determining protein RodA [Candidatus Kapabacteria bacterium]|nr:rod shape-determining protein RodA [Candidatus Kapabacteria bacterium]